MENQTANHAKPFHQMVWIDHQEAIIYGVMRHELSKLAVIHAPDEGRGHVHHKAGVNGPGHIPLSPAFMLKVTAALADAKEILIVGPGPAKLALKSYIALNAPMMNKRVLGVEPMEANTEGQMQTFASLFFRQRDRMRS
jgi:stalled ribosome rescue protein Dom34